MTSVGSVEIPKHSKWHIAMGILVLLHAYVIGLLILRWWIARP